jgi:hypothetical protein
LQAFQLGKPVVVVATSDAPRKGSQSGCFGKESHLAYLAVAVAAKMILHKAAEQIQLRFLMRYLQLKGAKYLMTFGRRLGIDYGQARVGIAICDLDGLVATPLTTLRNDKKLFSNLNALIEEHNIQGIFLGKPIHLSGVEGATVELVSAFAQRFSESLRI